MIKLFIKEITDNYIRDNFQKLLSYLTQQAVLRCRFVYFEYEFRGAGTFDVAHGQAFVVRDVLLLSATNGITTTVHYQNFTKTTIQLQASAAGKARFLIGLYGDNA